MWLGIHFRFGDTAARDLGVRLADWTTVTRAKTLDGSTNEIELVTETAVALLRAYASWAPLRGHPGFERLLAASSSRS